MSDVASSAAGLPARVRHNQYGVLSPPVPGAWRPTRPVSLIIPAYNCQETLNLALAALRHQTYPAELLEVVVVDDGSGPALRLPEVAPANCRLVRAPDHTDGWGRANALRLGADRSDGEILHWLDADLVPFPGHVEAQARWHHVTGDAVVLGYKRFVRQARMPTVGQVLHRCATGTIDTLFAPDHTDGHDYVEQIIESSDGLRSADHLAFRAHVGATASLRRESYLEAGGLDPSLRLGEDSELGYRLAQVGAVFIPEPAARSWHLGPSHMMMRAGDALRRYNRPFLADRMAHPPWLRQGRRRGWAVPLVRAVVVAGDAPAEAVCDTVDQLLASDEDDLRVVLVADWDALGEERRPVLTDPRLDRRLVAATYRSEPRVELSGQVPGSGFPSPYLLEVPVGAPLDRGLVSRVVAEADERALGLLRVGSGRQLWRTAAVRRARRYARPGEPLADVVAEVWGSADAAAVPDAVPAVPRPAPPPAAPVPVAGLRSLVRATGYVARLAAARAVRRAGPRLPGSGVAAPVPGRLPATMRSMPLLMSVRRRVRLRTRLRRAREAWRSAFPRPLPPWDPPPDGQLGPPPPVPASGPVAVAATAANPRGRHRYGHRLPRTRLRLVTGGAGEVRWEAVRIPDGTVLVAGRAGDPLDQRQAAVLRELGTVTAGPAAAAPPAYAHVLVQLAMTGVIVHAPDLPAAAAERLAPELAGLLRAPLPGRHTDPLEWEIRSVRQRRAAMRHHAGLAPPRVTAVLVSKRPRLVGPALAACATQTYPELEIVLGTHGFEVPPPGPGVRVVPIGAGRNLGEALAEASAAATGTLVTKVDDDDRYGPEHIWDLVLAHHYSGATVVGKGAELVYLAPKDLTVRRRMAAEIGTDTVAGGTIMLARDHLAALGGWPAVPRWVDRALLDRALGDGGTVYRTHPLGFIYTRHGDGHTWEADLSRFQVGARRTWRGLPPYPEFGALPAPR